MGASCPSCPPPIALLLCHVLQVVFVGATVRDTDITRAVAAGWLVDPVVVAVGQPDRVPSGLSHVALVVEEHRKLATLARLLR